MNPTRAFVRLPALGVMVLGRALWAQEPLPPAPPAPPGVTQPKAPQPPQPPPSSPSPAPSAAPAPPPSAAPSPVAPPPPQPSETPPDAAPPDAPPDAPPSPPPGAIAPETPEAAAPPPAPPPPPPPPVPPDATVEVDRPPATATPSPQKPPFATNHRLFFEAAFGGGVLSATSGSDPDERTFTSPAVSFHVLVGGSVPRGWAVGAGFSRDHMPSLSVRDGLVDGDEPDVSDLTFSTTSFTVFADWHPSQADGFHAQAHLGLGWLTLDRVDGSSRSSELAWDTILGAGYDVRVSEHMTVGGLAQLTWLVVQANGSRSSTKVNLLVPSLLVTVAYR